MARYIENLSPHTWIGSVFNDIHRQVNWMLETVDGINEGKLSHVIGVGEHPGEAMTVSEHSSGQIVHPLEMPITRRELTVEVDNTRHRLLGITSMTDYARTYLPAEDRTYPVNVMGFRGDEHPQGDYSIARRGFQGNIAVMLGRTSFTEGVPSDEPIGTTEDIPLREIGDLSDESRERLTVVSDEILRRLSVARLIMLGGDPRDALLVLGRDVDFVDDNPFGLLVDSRSKQAATDY